MDSLTTFCHATFPELRSMATTANWWIWVGFAEVIPPPPARRPEGAVGEGESDADGSFGVSIGAVSMAVWRKIRLSQTMGEEVPWPGSFTFHLTCSFSLQVIGGFAFGPTPEPAGPRHW